MMEPALPYDPSWIDFDAQDPCLALRRHTDRCFFKVEEVVPGPGDVLAGFIVEGILISPEDVAELRRTDETGAPWPDCEPRM